MPLATLKDVLDPAKEQGYAVAGFVVLGWEDARAYVRAAEATNSPVILQAGPGCRAHTPLEVLAPIFRHLAETASVDVVSHLDHGYEAADCFKAVDLGFSSVMFDGSKLPIEENIEIARSISDYAHKHGVSVEGEVGYVGYADGANSAGTKVEEAALFAKQSGADAMAISIGNVHLQQEQAAEIDFDLLRKIEATSDIPLVLHGGSGIPSTVRQKLAHGSHVSKFNIGTEVRMAFGKSLRDVLSDNPEMFDRISILKPTEEAVFEAAKQVIKPLLLRS
jgi:fructose-bisphosphate aldolase class II